LILNTYTYGITDYSFYAYFLLDFTWKRTLDFLLDYFTFFGNVCWNSLDDRYPVFLVFFGVFLIITRFYFGLASGFTLSLTGRGSQFMANGRISALLRVRNARG
jgi:hypothetical protein